MLLAIILVILVPISYFAWRASQPMDLPEFNGLTYYQVIEWRKAATEDYIAKYTLGHHNTPEPKIGNRLDVCLGSSMMLGTTVGSLQSWWYTFWSWRDDQNRIAMLKADYPAPDAKVTFLNFIPSWWRSYEKLVLSNIKYQLQSPVAYCRVPANIPTPAKFEAMQQAH